MSIHVNHNFASMGTTAIFIDPSSAKSFNELVHRATNLWPDAPPEIKEFADKLIDGKIKQDYAGQATDKFDTRTVFTHVHKCSCGYYTSVNTKESKPPEYAITCVNPSIEVQLPNNKTRTVPCKRTEIFNPY